MDRLRINRLKFKAGAVPGAVGLEVDVPHVTVLVGPNNAGKSQTLRELEAYCQGSDPTLTILDSVDLTLPDTFDELRSMLELRRTKPPPDQIEGPDHFWIARPIIRHGEQELNQQVNEHALRSWFEGNATKQLRQVFVRAFTMRLDGRTRFDLVEPKATGPLESRPLNHLWALFVNDEAREKVRAFTEEAFARHFVVDPTGMTQFRVRLADRKPDSKAEEQALDETARAFHGQAPLISELGDGVRTSVGLVSAVMSLPDRILLIDEPEAFLHPTLARRVGRTLAETARDRDASLIVATHSSEFVMGCIQAAPNLRLIRLTFFNNQATARSIEPAEITKLMNDPLLRSANALRALFHRGVVVTEADADRAFYEEVNVRLLNADRGIEDTLFMNAQNWQTIPRIATPLRRLGVPAAVIFDFDVLMDDQFAHMWPLLSTDQPKLRELQNRRATVKQMMDAKGRTSCKGSGVGAFSEPDKTNIQSFINEMAKFGVFFVPVGELERWLVNLGIAANPKDKARWLTEMFTRMGADPALPDYVTADWNDVWEFIGHVRDWISDPNRLGIPT